MTTFFLWVLWLLVVLLMSYVADTRDKLKWQELELNYLKGVTESLLRINKKLNKKLIELENNEEDK